MSLRLIAGFGAGLGATLAYQEYHDRHGDPPPLGWLRLLLTPRVLGSRRDGGAPKPPRGTTSGPWRADLSGSKKS